MTIDYLTDEPMLQVTHTFAAPQDLVFTAFTTAEHFAVWFGGSGVEVDPIEMDGRVGGAWSGTMHLPDGNTIDWTGSFLEVDRPNRVVLTLTDQPGVTEPAPVAIDLTASGDGTVVTLSQWGDFPPEQVALTIQGYQQFMAALDAHLKALLAG